MDFYGILRQNRRGKNMVFELRHYDTALLRFDAQMDTLAMEAKILWVSEEHRALLPLIEKEVQKRARALLDLTEG